MSWRSCASVMFWRLQRLAEGRVWSNWPAKLRKAGMLTISRSIIRSRDDEALLLAERLDRARDDQLVDDLLEGALARKVAMSSVRLLLAGAAILAVDDVA